MMVGVANDENSGRGRVEALDRLQQADQRDLAEVVERLAAVREPPGEELGEAHVLLDELVAQRAVTCPAVLDESPVDRGVVTFVCRLTHDWRVVS